MTKSFVEYIKQQPMVFEVFGHYQSPALHRVAIQDVSNQQIQQVSFKKKLDIFLFLKKIQKSNCSRKSVLLVIFLFYICLQIRHCEINFFTFLDIVKIFVVQQVFFSAAVYLEYFLIFRFFT